MGGDGRERLLARYDLQSLDGSTHASDAVLAGTYAALKVSWVDFHYGGNSNKVELFDLRTGGEFGARGGEFVACADYSYSCDSGIDRIVLGSDAVSKRRAHDRPRQRM